MNGQPAHARLAVSSDALAAGVLVDFEGRLIDVLSDG